MTLDQTFANEIRRQANGDGSRMAKFEFKRKVEETRRAMSTPTVLDNFGNFLGKYGRVPVAICVAETITERREQMHSSSYSWAQEVLKLYKNAPYDKLFAYIDDGLHPSRIEEYAKTFMQVTTM